MKAHSIDSSPPAAQRPERELLLVPPASAAVRARQLMAEARAAALDNLTELMEALEAARSLAESVAAGGDLYDVGVRELSGRLSEDLLWRGRSLRALAEREHRGLLPH